MEDGTELDLSDFMGELQELHGRVVGVDLRDPSGQVVAHFEGEFGVLRRNGPDVSFRVGGVPPRDREGIRFIASSHGVVHIAPFVSARRHTGGVVTVVHARTASGLRIEIWPAMPPTQQYTEQHDDNR
jgi:hypothetical protein